MNLIGGRRPAPAISHYRAARLPQADGNIVPPPPPQSLSSLHGVAIRPTPEYAERVATAAAIVAAQQIQYLHKEVRAAVCSPVRAHARVVRAGRYVK